MLFAEVVGGAGEDDFSVVEEDNVVEDAFDVGDEVGRDEDGGAFGEVSEDGVEDEIARGGVNAAERFVEDVEAGASRHNKDELEFFLHAFGHFFELHGFFEVEAFEHFEGFLAVEIFVEGFEEVEVVFDGSGEVEVGAFGEVGDFCLGLGAERAAFEFDFSAGGDEEGV